MREEHQSDSALSALYQRLVQTVNGKEDLSERMKKFQEETHKYREKNISTPK